MLISLSLYIYLYIYIYTYIPFTNPHDWEAYWRAVGADFLLPITVKPPRVGPAVLSAFWQGRPGPTRGGFSVMGKGKFVPIARQYAS